jgi:hypothetical protein
VISSPFTHLPADAKSLTGITRCIRRICLLLEQDNAAEAARLEQNEFANALRDIRLALGPDALPESELRAMFAAEEKRVADAVVLSELLIPELIKSLPAAPAFPPPTRPGSLSASGLDSPTPFPRAAAAAGVSPIIADLLDAMLASERTGRRPLSSAKS